MAPGLIARLLVFVVVLGDASHVYEGTMAAGLGNLLRFESAMLFAVTWRAYVKACAELARYICKKKVRKIPARTTVTSISTIVKPA